ncbi:MAG: hypothetical protein H0W64_00335 [Gammaproteobacteria bacterium]|nr:hypothetical protein [Gammaproteobacteria bacterium]
MKKLILLALGCCANLGFAGELQQYSDVKQAIISGIPIHIVIDFTKCTSNKGVKIDFHAKELFGSLTPNEIAVVDDHIAASFFHFTLDHPKHLDMPVYEFGKYSLTNDNILHFSHQTLDARTFYQNSEKSTYHCKLNQAVKIYS